MTTLNIRTEKINSIQAYVFICSLWVTFILNASTNYCSFLERTIIHISYDDSYLLWNVVIGVTTS